jgi:hypothetical protein
MRDISHCFIISGAIVSQVPQVRQTTLQLVQQLGMAVCEKPYGAEKEMLNCHLPTTGLNCLRRGGLFLRSAHSKSKPFILITLLSLYKAVVACMKHWVDKTANSWISHNALATWMWE